MVPCETTKTCIEPSQELNHLQGFDPFESPFTPVRLFTLLVAVTLLGFSLYRAFPSSAMAEASPYALSQSSLPRMRSLLVL